MRASLFSASRLGTLRLGGSAWAAQNGCLGAIDAYFVFVLIHRISSDKFVTVAFVTTPSCTYPDALSDPYEFRGRLTFGSAPVYSRQLGGRRSGGAMLGSLAICDVSLGRSLALPVFRANRWTEKRDVL
jgi:hypothetical protein